MRARRASKSTSTYRLTLSRRHTSRRSSGWRCEERVRASPVCPGKAYLAKISTFATPGPSSPETRNGLKLFHFWDATASLCNQFFHFGDGFLYSCKLFEIHRNDLSCTCCELLCC